MSIRAEGLRYTFPGADAPVLDGISFEVPDGCVTSVIGVNGAGKSTLLKSVVGILRSEGEVWIGGVRRRELSHQDLHRQIGYMTQENALATGLSVLDVVLLGRLGSLNIRVPDETIEKAVSMLRLLHLDAFLERPFYALSGGQRRMVDAAQTLVRDPAVLIMDEPTANLDLANELQVLELVRSYTRQKNTATLLTLHDLNLAARYSDRLILLKDGRIFREGTPEEVITEDNLKSAFGVDAHVHISSRTGTPMVLPLKPRGHADYAFG